MIIKIEDAPAVKHITIDIDFTGEGEATTVITKDNAKKTTPNFSLPKRDDTLNTDEDFTQTVEEVIAKPEIVHEEREVKVSEDMQNMEI